MHIQNVVKICQFILKILSGNEILAKIKGHYSGTNERKITCNNPNIDIVYINAHKTFGEKLSFHSQYIERKRMYDRWTDGRTKVMTDNPNPL